MAKKRKLKPPPKKAKKKPKKPPPRAEQKRKKLGTKKAKKPTALAKTKPKRGDGKRKEATKIAKRIEKEHRGSEVSNAELRLLAKTDYVTDPQRRSARALWEDDRRPYNRAVTYRTFEVWQAKDKWSDRREQYWREVTSEAISAIQQRVAIQRLKELDEITDAADYMFEYLQPLYGEDGAVRRYPDDHEKYPGLPVFPLEMPRMDQWVKMWIEVDKQRMLKRGEATSRTEEIHSGEDGEEGLPKLSEIDPVIDPVRQRARQLDPEEVHRLAQAMLHVRQPELINGHPSAQVEEPEDAEYEDVEEDEEDTDE